MMMRAAAIFVSVVGLTSLLGCLSVSKNDTSSSGSATQNAAGSNGSITVTDIDTKGLLHAGDRVPSQCFDVTVPVASFGEAKGCRMALALAPAAGATPDYPYFQIEVLSDAQLSAAPTPLARAQVLLNDIAAKNAGVPPVKGVPVGPDGGKYDSRNGAYKGMRETTVDGRPAEQLTWGFERTAPNINNCVIDSNTGKSVCSHTVKSEFVAILVASPAGHFMWDGKPADTFYITGHTVGYQSAAFKAALAGVKLH